MAHKKGQGSTKNNRDSESKRLGVKIYGGQAAISGNIIIRQRGTKFHPGQGVGLGKDHTIYALRDGIVTFTTKKANKKVVHVLPIDERIEVKDLDPKNKSNNTTLVEAKKEAPKAEVKKAEPKKEAPKAAAKSTDKPDDLTKIEGIGPKIAETLTNAGIETFDALSKANPSKIEEIISDVRGNHVPGTWPKQAKMAAEGKWDELKEYQDILDGGVEPS